MKRILLVIPAAAIALTGCGAYENSQGRGDAPVDQANIDDSPAQIINFPDTFANVATKCHNGVGIYVTTAGTDNQMGSGKVVAVLGNDPNCPQPTNTTTSVGPVR